MKWTNCQAMTGSFRRNIIQVAFAPCPSHLCGTEGCSHDALTVLSYFWLLLTVLVVRGLCDILLSCVAYIVTETATAGPAGYVRLGSKRLFYYFVLSQRSPSSDPVVLWLNGGGYLLGNRC